eukprot:7272427-Prorocentrum_lima.AAC.1
MKMLPSLTNRATPSVASSSSSISTAAGMEGITWRKTTVQGSQQIKPANMGGSVNMNTPRNVQEY